MGKTFNILQFPGHKSKAFTLSYDDGVLQDKRLIELFDRYGVKCTFNLGYGVLGVKGEAGPEGQRIDISKVETKEVKELYKNHEVGGHGLYHSDLAHIGLPNAMYEIVEDKAKLESLVGYPLSMFAYPFGLYNEDVKQLLKQAGYKGARTVKSTHSFDLPEDPFECLERIYGSLSGQKAELFVPTEFSKEQEKGKTIWTITVPNGKNVGISISQLTDCGSISLQIMNME